MLKRKLNLVAFRIKVRKALSDSEDSQILITYEEAKRMCERRRIKV